jgi:hypothetical protein
MSLLSNRIIASLLFYPRPVAICATMPAIQIEYTNRPTEPLNWCPLFAEQPLNHRMRVMTTMSIALRIPYEGDWGGLLDTVGMWNPMQARGCAAFSRLKSRTKIISRVVAGRSIPRHNHGSAGAAWHHETTAMGGLTPRGIAAGRRVCRAFYLARDGQRASRRAAAVPKSQILAGSGTVGRSTAPEPLPDAWPKRDLQKA